MDKIGETPLVKPDVFEKAIPFLQKLPPEKLAAVFYFRVNFDPLFRTLSSSNISGLKELFSGLSTEQCAAIFLDDFGPVVNYWGFDLLGKLSTEQLIAVLSSPKAPLHNFYIFENIDGLLISLPTEHLVTVLSTQNDNGDSVLGNPLIFEKAGPLLIRSGPERLAALLSIPDREGKALWEKPLVMEKIISFRRNARLPEEFITFFKEFLTIKATGGKTFLHNLANEIISLLHPLPFDRSFLFCLLRIRRPAQILI